MSATSSTRGYNPDRDHPLRSALSAEMHMRKLPWFELPAQILQIVLICDAASGERALRQLLAEMSEDIEIEAGSRFYSTTIKPLKIIWESHSEFCTYTLISRAKPPFDFNLSAFENILNRTSILQGEIIRSTNTLLISKTTDTNSPAKQCFAQNDLIISEVFAGKARVWSDFRLHPDGFGRMLIEDVDLEDVEAAVLAQRLLELGNYRKVALLGLPVAKQSMGKLNCIERELTELADSLTADAIETRYAMDRLNSVGSQLSQISMQSRYRMAATAAYFAIVKERIDALSPTAEPGKLSLSDFTERRLGPAMRTCEAFTRRLRELIQDTSDVTNRVRARIDDDLARKNQDMLRAMGRRTELQLRLQQTVEGLSIVAITYYAIGIWKVLESHLAKAFGIRLDESVLAVAVFVPLTVWFLLRRIRARHTTELDH